MTKMSLIKTLSYFFNFFLVGMMRHMMKCPQEQNQNVNCQYLHHPLDLKDLSRHVQTENDEIHRAIRLDNEGNFVNPEVDLKSVYVYTKRFFEDLEDKVRNFIFKPMFTPVARSNATYLAVDPTSNVFLNSDVRYYQ